MIIPLREHNQQHFLSVVLNTNSHIIRLYYLYILYIYAFICCYCIAVYDLLIFIFIQMAE